MKRQSSRGEGLAGLSAIILPRDSLLRIPYQLLLPLCWLPGGTAPTYVMIPSREQQILALIPYRPVGLRLDKALLKGRLYQTGNECCLALYLVRKGYSCLVLWFGASYQRSSHLVLGYLPLVQFQFFPLLLRMFRGCQSPLMQIQETEIQRESLLHLPEVCLLLFSIRVPVSFLMF